VKHGFHLCLVTELAFTALSVGSWCALEGRSQRVTSPPKLPPSDCASAARRSEPANRQSIRRSPLPISGSGGNRPQSSIYPMRHYRLWWGCRRSEYHPEPGSPSVMLVSLVSAWTLPSMSARDCASAGPQVARANCNEHQGTALSNHHAGTIGCCCAKALPVHGGPHGPSLMERRLSHRS
jgi:hypothetical protein